MPLPSRVMYFNLLLLAITSPAVAQAPAATLERIKTPRGVNQAFILLRPAKPTAAVILFAGGHGGLSLTGPSAMAWGAGNFLVRSRDKFAAQDLMVAVVDAPSDQSGGMNAMFRMSSGTPATSPRSRRT